jgi:hypothetical protein
MIKRILIISLNILFIVTTTGLPIYIQFCSDPLEKEPIEISMYLNKNANGQMDGCAQTGNQQHLQLINLDCCKYVSLVPLIKDKYTTLKTGTARKLSLKATLNFSIANLITIKSTSKLFADQLSPPVQKDNQIYLSNSILLI